MISELWISMHDAMTSVLGAPAVRTGPHTIRKYTIYSYSLLPLDVGNLLSASPTLTEPSRTCKRWPRMHPVFKL
jgi:hypothetical protein